MTLYVDNLPHFATEQELREHFESCGVVHSVSLGIDRNTGRTRGFGFVEMDRAAAALALERLDGKSFHSRVLRVSEAQNRSAPTN